MNERLEALERALRNAHAAGDSNAARRFAAEIRRIRTDGVAAPPLSRSMAGALAADVSSEAHAPTQAEIAQDDVAGMTEMQRRASASNQGVGSALLGIGTPLTAAGRMIGAAMPGGDEPVGPGEAMEYARARREALQESNPGAFYSGVGGGIVVGGLAGRAAAGANATLGAAARALTPVRGKGWKIGAQNAGRLAAAGSAGASATALNESGVEAVPGAAVAGAVFAPALVGAGKLAVGAGHAVVDRLSGHERAAFKVLARRIGTSPRELQRRFSEFMATWGRAPRLVEIMEQTGAEELGQVGRVRTEAGKRLRDAADEARLVRQGEAQRTIQGRGRISSPTAVEGQLGEITEQAAAVPRRGLRTTGPEVLGARDVAMNRTMETIGDHNVYLDDDMLNRLRDPDIWDALPGTLRRRIAQRIDAGEDAGTVALTVREWDMIRQELGNRAGSGVGQIFKEGRDEVTQYVGRAVPEYGEALRQYGQRSDFARGVDAGPAAFNDHVTDFAARLRTAGGGTATTPLRPEVRQAEIAGMGPGARTRLADMLSGDEATRRKTMERLARDPALRRNLSRVLEPGEMAELETIGDNYGIVLDFGEGLKRGSGILRQGQDDFREAVAVSSPAARRGVEVGARTALSEAAGESPDAARATLESLAENEGLRNRITAAMGVEEAGRLRRVGRTGTRAARNLEAATPSGTQASARAAERASETQKIIGAGVVAFGRASGAMIANVGNWIVQHTTLSKKAANRLAEMALDPNQAHKVIARLRRAGVDPDRILRMYRESAIAAGIQIGRE